MTPPLPGAPIPSTRSPAPPERADPTGAAGALPVFSVGGYDVHDGAVRVPLRGELDAATGPTLTAGLALLAYPADDAAGRTVIGSPLTGGTPTGRTPSVAVNRAEGAVLAGWRGFVHLEMSGVTFLDTSGLTVLDAARSTLIAAGWRVCLTHPQPAVLSFLNFAIDAGWFPTDAACDDVQHWRQRTITGPTAPAAPAGASSPAPRGAVGVITGARAERGLP